MRFQVLFVFIIGLMALPGCEKEADNESLKEGEKRLLDQYLKSNNITTPPTASGLYFISLEPGEGSSPGPGSWVDISYVGKLLDGTVFETNLDSVASWHGIWDPGAVYGMTRLLVDDISMDGLKEGIQLMAVGETARLIIPSDLGIGGDSRLRIPPYSTLIFDITLMDEFKDPEKRQAEDLIEYFGEPGFLSDTTQEGIYYIEEEFGWGDTILSGDDVFVWYKGSFLDGRVFDSNLGGSTLTVYYPDQSNIIPGFMSALKYMRAGAKAKVIIPYQKAYGRKGALNNHGQVVIPPYMPLIFDIEVESIW